MATVTTREHRFPAKKILRLLNINGQIKSFVTPAKHRNGKKTTDILEKELLIIEQISDDRQHAS